MNITNLLTQPYNKDDQYIYAFMLQQLRPQPQPQQQDNYNNYTITYNMIKINAM